MSQPLDYSTPRPRRTRPILATAVCSVLGITAVIVWMTTFQPHGGVELSLFLFPIAHFLLEAIDAYFQPQPSFLPYIWYGLALGQWVIMGIAIDAVRFWRRRGRKLARSSIMAGRGKS